MKRLRENDMAESVYKVIELEGTSTEFWEKAARIHIYIYGISKGSTPHH